MFRIVESGLPGAAAPVIAGAALYAEWQPAADPLQVYRPWRVKLLLF